MTPVRLSGNSSNTSEGRSAFRPNPAWHRSSLGLRHATRPPLPIVAPTPGPGRRSGAGIGPAGPKGEGCRSAAPSRMATVEFAVNKTGGRIMMMAPADDSLLVEAARVRLLETLAGLRRGDFRGVDVTHLDSPAAKELVRLRTRLRYAFRALPLGGEIV